MVKEMHWAYTSFQRFFDQIFLEIRGHQWSRGRLGLHGIMKRFETYSRASDNPSQESVLRGPAKTVSSTGMEKRSHDLRTKGGKETHTARSYRLMSVPQKRQDFSENPAH